MNTVENDEWHVMKEKYFPMQESTYTEVNKMVENNDHWRQIYCFSSLFKHPIKFFGNLSDNEPLSFRLCYKSVCSVFFSCADNFFLCSWFYHLFCSSFIHKCFISIDYFNINWSIFYGGKTDKASYFCKSVMHCLTGTRGGGDAHCVFKNMTTCHVKE